MTNKTIAIFDVNSFHKQNIETLLFACILEKKVNKLTVLDLNHYEQDIFLPKRDEWRKEAEILTTSIFSNTSYKICAKPLPDQNKLLNLANGLKTNNNILIINVNSQQYQFNSKFYELADEIVLFADLERDVSSNIVNFFLRHAIGQKKIHLIVHNYKLNIQSEKIYLQLLKQFKAPNVTISNIDVVPSFNSLQEIENVDPWKEIYKKINSAF